MRREGHIIKEIVDYTNMAESFMQVLRGKKRKRSRQGKCLLAHRGEVIAELSAQIAEGTFRVSGYRERTITEGGKLRRIQVLTMKDRIAVHAIMSVVDKHLRKRFIRTTSASIKNRGMHDLLNYIRKDLKQDPEGTQFCYKFDISKFYESVRQDFVMYCVRRIFKDRKLIEMLDGFVRMMPEGLSIGLRSSQGLGNLLLSVYLDHYLKDKYGVRHFYRYCDDGVVLGNAKSELWVIRDAVHEQMEQIDLKVKANECVFPVDEGIDFLGYVIYPDHVRLRKRIKQKFARKMHEIKSRKRRRVLIASFYGMAKHADCKMLFKKLTNKDMDDFSELKKLIPPYRDPDGKKRFRGKRVSIKLLQNKSIQILDIEKDVKTENGPRHLVHVDDNGELKKYFTSDREMKYYLEQFEELKLFPKPVTVEYEDMDGFGHYVLSFDDPDNLIPTYRDEQGKKRIKGKEVQLRALLNKRIRITEFERDIKTKYGLRHLVGVDDNGVLKKYFTDDKEMKYFLEKFEEIGKIPFPTTIGYDDSDGFSHYIFT